MFYDLRTLVVDLIHHGPSAEVLLLPERYREQPLQATNTEYRAELGADQACRSSATGEVLFPYFPPIKKAVSSPGTITT